VTQKDAGLKLAIALLDSACQGRQTVREPVLSPCKISWCYGSSFLPTPFPFVSGTNLCVRKFPNCSSIVVGRT